MKHLATITDKDITGSNAICTAEPRIAVSTVLFDNDNNIALCYYGKFNLHTVVGGGVDRGEDLITAAKREALEETGYNCEIICEIGSVFEGLAEIEFAQKRYYYIARIVGEKSETRLTEKEIAIEMSIQWHSIEKSLQLISDISTSDYRLKFTRQCDIIALNEVITNHAHLIGDTP